MGSLPSRVDYTPMSHHMSILQEVARERYDLIYSFSNHYYFKLSGLLIMTYIYIILVRLKVVYCEVTRGVLTGLLPGSLSQNENE